MLLRITTIHEYLSSLSEVSSVTLIFNDQPCNDFSSLAQTIDQSMPVLSRHGKLPVFPYMVPKSFQERVAPDHSVDVGICSSSLHWLDPASPGIGHQYLPSATAAAPAAHRELVSFLSLRAREIRHGGRLILGVAGKGDLNIEPALQCLSLAIDDLTTRGLIPCSAASTCRGPVYFRTELELCQAVEAEGSWVITQQRDTAIPENGSEILDGNHNGPLGEASFDTLCQSICSTIIGSAGNTILTAVRKHADDVDESRLLKELSVCFMDHFRRLGETRVGGHFYFLRLLRRGG